MTSAAREAVDFGPSAASGLEAAIARCIRRGGRITPLRRRVLAALWKEAAPVGAYELRDRLESGSQPPVPLPSVYRSLDFLCSHGLAARISRFNAFVACRRPDQSWPLVFLLCDVCRRATPVSRKALQRRILAGADAHGFEVEHCVVELTGACAACRDEAP